MPKKQIGVEHKVALKRKRTKQIVAFVMIGIVLILAGLVVAGACVNVNLAPATIESPSIITVYDKTTMHGTFSREDAEYDAFMEKYNDMFTTSYLNALFNGGLNGYTISSQDAKDVQSLSSVQTKLREGYYVHFDYLDNPQVLKYANGKPCPNARNNYYAELTYTNVYFAIADNDELADFKIYVVVKFSSLSSEQESVLELSLKANTSILYNNLESFKTN